jgi:predicted metal-dependent phosphoesterase TrpH
VNTVLTVKIDFHVHTCYSSDSVTNLEEVVACSRKKRLNGVAVTDHGTVEGALKLLGKKNDGLIIIPGIEVSTNRGHILGVNITTHIPQNIGIEESIERIHDAGGIAIAPHPLAFFKGGIWLNRKNYSVGIDAIEVLNSSVIPFFPHTCLSKKLARSLHLPEIAGSDSHFPETIGLAFTNVEGVSQQSNVEEIVEAIKKGMTVPLGRAVPWSLRLQKIMQKKKVFI